MEIVYVERVKERCGGRESGGRYWRVSGGGERVDEEIVERVDGKSMKMGR